MRGNDDINVIPYRKVLKKKREFPPNGFLLSVSEKVMHIQQIKNQSDSEGEIPMHKWIMPHQRQRYLKYSDHDFL
jgi:hypothetical protein